ncbi:hypothetical protein RvY_14293-2 [Ramazzottius varieornatus]|uniref:Uncharacterized protein n=1 Tax=Ramazzottius varieornatus TaxID=947166 RepID=A0A1D1VQU6_RAMVA|nr:hypothetical protein RvY_14293-2 [Ramazzottius varieornatus]
MNILSFVHLALWISTSFSLSSAQRPTVPSSSSSKAGLFEDSPIIFGDTSRNTSQLLPMFRFPRVPVPEFEQRIIDQALKAAQKSLVHTLNIEDQQFKSAKQLAQPRTAQELISVAFKLQPDAKKISALGYVLEGMTTFLANRSQLTREQLLFGLPSVPVAHPTIVRRCPYRFNRDEVLGLPSTACENVAPFRNITGLCNNAQNAFWGATYSPFTRFLPHHYADAVKEIRKSAANTSLPNPRYVSSSIHWQLPGTHSHVTQMLTTWAQFIDQDLSFIGSYFGTVNQNTPTPDMMPVNCCSVALADRHPECLAIEVDNADIFTGIADLGCMDYVRSAIVPKMGCALGPRDQVNQATHFLDGSTIYGSTDQDVSRLREFDGGRLWTTEFENGKSLLPEQTNSSDCRPAQDKSINCFDSGSVRVNENLPMAVIYTLFAREHNRLAQQLASLNRHWDDEQLYQNARKIVIAEIQHITFNEFLPLVLGREQVERYNVQLVDHGFYRGYSIDSNPGITNEFATASFKFWHTLMDNRTEFIDRRGRASFKPLNTQWYQPYDLYFAGVFDGTIQGLSVQPARPGDQSITSALTAEWLQVVNSTGRGLDLAAITIQQGRDHGLRSYNTWREACGLLKAKNFDDLRDTISTANIDILKAVYGSVDDIDLYTGGLSEVHTSGAVVGPVFRCIIAKQFHNIRRSDRYWYENDMPETGFTKEQLNEIRGTTLARIVCQNSDAILTLHPQVMLQPDELLNAPVSCQSDAMPPINLRYWQDNGPIEISFSKEELTNIVEKARKQMQAAVAEDISRAGRQAAAGLGRARIPFNIPTPSVRQMSIEASVFMQSTKELAKREISNRTIVNMTTTLAKIRRFNGLIKAKLEGPIEGANCTERLAPCDHSTKYRTASGWCNNLKNPDWGSSERIYGRLLDPAYFDLLDEPRNTSVTGSLLPSARQVQIGVVVDTNKLHPRYTHLLMTFGQFLDHDVTLTPIATAANGFNFNCKSCDAETESSPNCRPIRIPDTDTDMSPFVNGTTERRCLAFIRSASGRRAFGAREQINQNTAYIDGSNIYGSNLCRTQRLRSFQNGRMNTTRNPKKGYRELLPQTTVKDDVEFLECKNQVAGNACFLSGDTRENENPALTVQHTIWMRYHNSIAGELQAINPHWDDERLFQETRRIIVAVFQHVVYSEYLPRVLGQAVADRANLRPKKTGYYTDYDETCDATIANEFAAAAFRFGHTLVRGEFGRYNNDLTPAYTPVMHLYENFARSDVLYEEEGLDQLLIGLTLEPMQEADAVFTKALSDFLFFDPGRKGGNFTGQDLIAINIMRGRDHGIPPYNDLREYCNLTRAGTFADLKFYMPEDVVDRMMKVYQSAEDLDIYVSGVAEFSVYGGVVGPTFACLIAEQFYRSRKCDRFWYETGDPAIRFSEDQLASIRKQKLAKVLCENSDTMDNVQRSVFDMPDSFLNPYVKCGQLPDLDLSLWKESSSCNVSGITIQLGRSAKVSPCLSCTCTKEGPFCQSVVIRNCRKLMEQFPLSDLMSDSICRAQCLPIFRIEKKDVSLGSSLLLDQFAPFL